MAKLEENHRIPVVLSIAGSDSGGGAGIQADLKTFTMHRLPSASVLTCVTAQNTMGVTRVEALSSELVLAQMQAVYSDLTIVAAKTGMLLNQSLIETVANFLSEHPVQNLVVDPVMISRSGHALLDGEALQAMRTSPLLSLAKIVTPNRHEAELLADTEVSTVHQMKHAAQKIFDLGGACVLIKGGAIETFDRGTDVWFDGTDIEVLPGGFIDTKHTHGTGCSLSAAIVSNLALEMKPIDACIAAKKYVTEALRHSLQIGAGNGPICHYYLLKSGGIGAF